MRNIFSSNTETNNLDTSKFCRWFRKICSRKNRQLPPTETEEQKRIKAIREALLARPITKSHNKRLNSEIEVINDTEKHFLSSALKVEGHYMVDLGLSVKWATCNVGADKPEEYGNYYSWGEIYEKKEYSNNNSTTYEKNIEDISGNTKFDVATAKWGVSWRMPTKTEMMELKEKCKWNRCQLHGVDGLKIEGPNGNCIFLPAAGYRYKRAIIYNKIHGGYWTSSPSNEHHYRAYFLVFTNNNYEVFTNLRYLGQSVRPVCNNIF